MQSSSYMGSLPRDHWQNIGPQSIQPDGPLLSLRRGYKIDDDRGDASEGVAAIGGGSIDYADERQGLKRRRFMIHLDSAPCALLICSWPY